MGSEVGKAWKKYTPAGMLYEGMKTPELPDPTPLPAPVEDVDVEGQKQYTKGKLKRRKGLKSTILTKMGSSNTGGKTVLG